MCAHFSSCVVCLFSICVMCSSSAAAADAAFAAPEIAVSLFCTRRERGVSENFSNQ